MLIGIDASRAARIQPTGTEAYSRQLIQALLQIEPQYSLKRISLLFLYKDQAQVDRVVKTLRKVGVPED